MKIEKWMWYRSVEGGKLSEGGAREDAFCFVQETIMI